MRIEINDIDNKNGKLSIAESLLFCGNGNIGFRNVFDEQDYDNYESKRETYLNGFYDTYAIKYPESYYGCSHTGEQLIPIIDGQTTKIIVNSVELDFFKHEISNHKRYVDLEKGIAVREFQAHIDGENIIVKITKIASFHNLDTISTKYEFDTLGKSIDVKLKTLIKFDQMQENETDDPRISQHIGIYDVKKNNLDDQTIYIAARTSKVEAYMHWDVSTINEKKNRDSHIEVVSNYEGSPIIKTMQYSLTKNFSEIVDFDLLLSEQEKYLGEFWKVAKVIVKSVDDIQESINYGSYALLQSVGINSIAAKGLSGLGYEGHVFWDAEMFVQPLFVKTNPIVAKQMIEYRKNMFDKALENRVLVGYEKGILFPWRTISGNECSAFFEAGMAQHHINLDISHSILSYIKYTGDHTILDTHGWDILIQCARLFAEIGYFKDGFYHIDKVTGPDEYSALVNDNYYTNVLYKLMLEGVLELWHEKSDLIREYSIKENWLYNDECKMFEKIVNKIYLGYDEELNIIKQDRDFLNKDKWPKHKNKHPLLLNYHPLEIYRHQVSKQADAVLGLIFNYENLDETIIRDTIEYYDEVTTHDSSLSFSSFATVYAKLKHAKAYDYFMKNAELDLKNLHHNTKDGIHTASMGGTHQTLVEGFGGLKIKGDSITFQNNLPQEITYLEFNVIFRGQVHNVVIDGIFEPVVTVKG